jgi:hypothetical protein
VFPTQLNLPFLLSINIIIIVVVVIIIVINNNNNNNNSSSSNNNNNRSINISMFLLVLFGDTFSAVRNSER